MRICCSSLFGVRGSIAGELAAGKELEELEEEPRDELVNEEDAGVDDVAVDAGRRAGGFDFWGLGAVPIVSSDNVCNTFAGSNG